MSPGAAVGAGVGAGVAIGVGVGVALGSFTAGFVVGMVIALGITAWKIMQRDAAQPGVAPVRADLVFEDSNAVSPAYEVSRIAISPDGSRVAVAARDVVWIRALGSSRAVAVGTAIAFVARRAGGRAPAAPPEPR